MADRDYFLMLEGIPGESSDPKHPSEIGVSDFGITVHNRGKRAHYGAGRPNFDEVSFSADIDQSYPKLEQMLLTNARVPKGVLTCRKAGKTQQDYLKVTFTDIFITSVKIESKSIVPAVTFSIGFVKIEFQYREQREDGTLGGTMVAQFDVSKSK